jgi:hypothetical protein
MVGLADLMIRFHINNFDCDPLTARSSDPVLKKHSLLI